MRSWMSSLAGCVILGALLGSSCVSSTSAPSASAAETPLVIKALFSPSVERKPVGWIYAYEDEHGGKNLCVYVWSDSTWSLAEETVPGYFGDQLAHGCIGTADTNGMHRALDFPMDALDGRRRVYVGGHEEATWKGQAIAHGRGSR